MADWKPYKGTADVQGPLTEHYPEKIEEECWFLLGIWNEDRAVYLNYEERTLHHVSRDSEGELVEERTEDLEKQISDYVMWHGSHSDDRWDTWSKIAWPVYTAELMGGREALTGQERLVYAFRHIYDISRKDTARFFGKSPNTIDNQYGSAKRKVQNIIELANYLEEDLGVE